ncbi:seipin isoform X1 [Ixodes scapularis]
MIWTLLRLPCTVVAAIKQLVARTFFLAVVFSVITWSSILLYGMFYWSYIPKSSHLFPVHLHFESRSCPEGFCDYPVANVTVVRPGYGEYLARGQRYKIYLDLEMPESDANQRIGMFTVKIDMITETGEVVRSSLRSGVLRYKSAMVRLFSTLTYIPMLMFGSAEEKQIVSVLLFDRYEEDYERPATQASIVIRNKFIEVYTATLKIYADFTGLRYLLYNWPLCSAIIGISTNFFFVALVALLSWHRLAPAKPRRRRRLSRRRSVSSARTEDENVSVSGESLEDEEQPDLVKETIEAQEAVVRRRRQRDLEELNETTSSSEFQWEPTEPSADTSQSTASS